MKKALLWLITALILIANVAALSIAPGHTDIVFEPTTQHKVRLKIINTDAKECDILLYAEGELSDYVSFTESIITFRADEREKLTTYTVNLPAEFEKQGLHTSKIIARELPPKSESKGVAMSASVAIVSTLNVMVPYTGSYAEITLFSPHFEDRKQNNFAVEVRNLGTEELLNARIVIDIYDPMNTKLESLNSDTFSLESKQNEVIVVKWTPSLGPGRYRAVATLIYEGMNIRDEKKFTIGELLINIVDISVKDFTLGGIAKFDIMLENKWNEKIPGVYGDVQLKDASGKLYTKFKTASVDIGDHDMQPIEAYWDTKNVGPGKYKFDIILNYLGKQTEEVFDILVSMDEIKTSPTGQAITPEEQGESGTILKGVYVLTFLVLLLIVFNVFIYFKKLKK